MCSIMGCLCAVKGYHSRLEIVSLEWPAFKVGPWLASGNLVVRAPYTDTKLVLNDKSSSLFIDFNCVNNMVYAEDPIFSWESGILACTRHM